MSEDMEIPKSKIRIFRLWYDWGYKYIAAETKEDAIKFYNETNVSVAIDELTDEQMFTHKLKDSTRSFRTEVQRLISNGESFPAFISSEPKVGVDHATP